MNYVEKIRWTWMALVLMAMGFLLYSIPAKAGIQEQKIAACMGQITAVRYLHKMVQDGFDPNEILTDLQKSYDGWQLDVSVRNLSWATYYKSNSADLLESRFYRACMDASEGPFNMKGPEG